MGAEEQQLFKPQQFNSSFTLSACIQARRNALRQSTRFCTVPALEAKLGCLGFLVRRTLRTLSVISSTWAWTLLKQMSDSGLQYWSIKTAPAKNKLYKKQDFSVFALLSFSSSKFQASSKQLQQHTRAFRLVCSHLLDLSQKLQKVSWHNKCH